MSELKYLDRDEVAITSASPERLLEELKSRGYEVTINKKED